MPRHPSFLSKITIQDIFFISLSLSLFLSLSLSFSLSLSPSLSTIKHARTHRQPTPMTHSKRSSLSQSACVIISCSVSKWEILVKSCSVLPPPETMHYHLVTKFLPNFRLIFWSTCCSWAPRSIPTRTSTANSWITTAAGATLTRPGTTPTTTSMFRPSTSPEPWTGVTLC